MLDRLYRLRHLLRLAGLALLGVGLGIAVGVDSAAGLALAATGALVLVPVQPLLLSHLRSRRAQRLASRNGHGPGIDAGDLDVR